MGIGKKIDDFGHTCRTTIPFSIRYAESMQHDISYFAQVYFRKDQRKFGIKQNDRLQHMYAVGKTGTGKTTMLESLILQDVFSNRGVAQLDPHGDSVERIFDQIPDNRKEDIIYLDLTDPNQPYRYNPMQKVSSEVRPLVVAGELSVFKRLFADSWGDRLEHILRFTLLALLEQPQSSLKDILPMIQDKGFRTKAIQHISAEEVREFWQREFKRYQDFHFVPIYNKIGQFLAYPVVRRVLFENTKDLQLRKIMDNKKILLVNLSTPICGLRGHVNRLCCGQTSSDHDVYPKQ